MDQTQWMPPATAAGAPGQTASDGPPAGTQGRKMIANKAPCNTSPLHMHVVHLSEVETNQSIDPDTSTEIDVINTSCQDLELIKLPCVPDVSTPNFCLCMVGNSLWIRHFNNRPVTQVIQSANVVFNYHLSCVYQELRAYGQPYRWYQILWRISNHMPCCW